MGDVEQPKKPPFHQHCKSHEVTGLECVDEDYEHGEFSLKVTYDDDYNGDDADQDPGGYTTE